MDRNVKEGMRHFHYTWGKSPEKLDIFFQYKNELFGLTTWLWRLKIGMWYPLVMFQKSGAGIFKILIFRPKIGHFVPNFGQKSQK